MGCKEFGQEEARGAKVTKSLPGLAFFFLIVLWALMQGKEETFSRFLFLFQLSSWGFYGGSLVRFVAFYDDWCLGQRERERPGHLENVWTAGDWGVRAPEEPQRRLFVRQLRSAFPVVENAGGPWEPQHVCVYRRAHVANVFPDAVCLYWGLVSHMSVYWWDAS